MSSSIHISGALTSDKVIATSKIDNYLAVAKMMSVEEIVSGCKRGKRKAQRALYDKYSKAMLGIAMRYSRNVSEAEDALQEAFIRIYKYIVDFDGDNEGALTAWVKTVVVNTTLSYNRKQKKHHFTQDIDEVQVGGDEEDYALMLEELDGQSNLQKIVLNAMQQLPDGYRNVFNLYVFEGYQHKEIAEILGVSESTSKSQLLKARKFLQKLITNELESR